MYERQGIQITPGVIEALQKTHDYALSIFLEFMLNVDGKCVSVSGKSFRIYSALRWELMCVFINTHMMVASDLNQNQNSSQTEHGPGPVDPLKLAERLRTRLTSAPVHEIIHDEEDHTVIRIAQFMLQKDLREELECFIASEMSMPFHMHSAHRALWLAVVKANKGTTTAFSLPELLEVFQAVVQEILKPAWLAFAADCADNFVSRGHFIEKADDVWKSSATLNEFVSLRMKYLIHLLSQTLSAAEAGHINFEANAISKAALKIFASIDLQDSSLQMLSVLDMLSASGDAWPKVWSEALQKKCSPQDVASFVADTLQLDIKALQDKWSAPKNSKVSDGGDDHQTRHFAEGDDEDAQNRSAHESKIDKNKQQEDEPDAEFDSSNRPFSLGRLMLFSGTSGSDLFDCSPEALELGIDKVSVMDIMNVKAQLEYLVWDQYTKDMIASGAFDWIVAKIDPKKKDLIIQADVKKVQKNLDDEKDMFLPYAGSVSMVPSRDSVKLAKVFGVEFFIQKAGCETHTLSPAWMARAVTRDDQAFFETKAFKKTLYMYLQSEDELGASPPTSEHQKEKEKKGGDDDNYGPDDGNSEPAHHDLILSWEKPEEESAQSVVEVSVHWAGICPDPKLDSKLKEIAKAKETKAQKKKVRNQKRRAGLQKKFDALTKKNDDVGAAAVKKQMDKLDGQGDDESEDGGAAVDLNECIPITRMQTPAEFEQKSARSKALADALFAAEDAAADALFGITGFKKALEETGCLKTKTTKKKMTTDKSVQDVLKMGTHLLK